MKNCRKEIDEDPLKGCCCCICKNCIPGIDNRFNQDGNYYCIAFLDYPSFPVGIQKISGHGICELYMEIKNG